MITRSSHKARRRKRRRRHVQTDFDAKLVVDKNGQHRGGKRPKAGRKPKGRRAGSPHKRRADVNPRHPQHLTLRVSGDVGSLRKRHMYRAIRAALVTVVANHVEFRIVHMSLQGTHIHLLCETARKTALTRGVQGFQISAAKHINAEVTKQRRVKRRGQVFCDRYHVQSMSSVRQTRHALAYVLNNWRRHREDHGGVSLFDGRIDPFSSGVHFGGWREPLPAIALPVGYDPPLVSRPQTWLLAESWKRAAPISVFEIPGPFG